MAARRARNTQRFAGNIVVDELLMAPLLGIGVVLILGIAHRSLNVSGAVLGALTY